jgi:hypothetical protein
LADGRDEEFKLVDSEESEGEDGEDEREGEDGDDGWAWGVLAS